MFASGTRLVVWVANDIAVVLDLDNVVFCIHGLAALWQSKLFIIAGGDTGPGCLIIQL